VDLRLVEIGGEDHVLAYVERLAPGAHLLVLCEGDLLMLLDQVRSQALADSDYPSTEIALHHLWLRLGRNLGATL